MNDPRELTRERLRQYLGLLKEAQAHALGAQGIRPDEALKALLWRFAELERAASEELLALQGDDAAEGPERPGARCEG